MLFEKGKRKGKLNISHRYNLIPLLSSDPGGILRELVVYDLPICKGTLFFCSAKNFFMQKTETLLSNSYDWLLAENPVRICLTSSLRKRVMLFADKVIYSYNIHK